MMERLSRLPAHPHQWFPDLCSYVPVEARLERGLIPYIDE